MFEVTTEYNKAALLAMNRMANRTSRRWSFRIRRIFLLVLGTVCLLSGILLLTVFGNLSAMSQVTAVVSPLVGVLALAEGLFLDRLGARISRRQMLKGSSRWTVRFAEEELFGENTDGVRNTYPLSMICAIYETSAYIFLQMDKRHCLALDKDGFTLGTCEDFRRFITEKTGMEICFVNIK